MTRTLPGCYGFTAVGQDSLPRVRLFIDALFKHIILHLKGSKDRNALTSIRQCCSTDIAEVFLWLFPTVFTWIVSFFLKKVPV